MSDEDDEPVSELIVDRRCLQCGRWSCPMEWDPNTGGGDGCPFCGTSMTGTLS